MFSAVEPSALANCTFLGYLKIYDSKHICILFFLLLLQGLRPTDFDGLADPYVRLQLIPTQSKVNFKIEKYIFSSAVKTFLSYVSSFQYLSFHVSDG